MNELIPESKGEVKVGNTGKRFGPVIGFLIEIGKIVIIAVAIIFVVRYFLIQPFVVKGASMDPTFHDKEYLIVDEMSFRLRAPVRGEVVVFHPPQHTATGAIEESSQYYIKRIIGLPGETVEIKDGKVTISNADYPNGILLTEEYETQITGNPQKVVVPDGQYFVMGDNRGASLDSRMIGTIPFENLIGRVWIRGFPLSRLGTFAAPTYNF
jgi:signal peptidase I